MGLLSDDAVQTLVHDDGGDDLAGVVFGFELVVHQVDEGVDPRDGLELYTAQYGGFESFGEGLLDNLGAGILQAIRVRATKGGEVGRGGGVRRWLATSTHLALEGLEVSEARVAGYLADEPPLEEGEGERGGGFSGGLTKTGRQRTCL